VTKTQKRTQKGAKKRLKRRFLGILCRLSDRFGASRHENGDESQQENQDGAAHRKHDRHQGDDGLYNVLLAVMVGVVVVGHVGFLNR
jgi:hypothetical protein